MPFRPTHYPDVHDEFYHPAGQSQRERLPIRDLGYDMGLKGKRVSAEFLDDQAEAYHSRLNSAVHTIDQRADIVRRRSGDALRNISLLALAIGGMIILGLALTVDYKIVHDFWTTVYANEFLVVPESLKDNVAFKSLQVLFAVLAIHFLISVPGVAGKAVRGVFMIAIGVMVVGMLIGLGFLATKSTLPAGASINGQALTRGADAREANEDLLSDLGLRPSSGADDSAAVTEEAGPEATSPAPTGNSLIDTYSRDPATFETFVFFGTFTLIFLFVSSVGALCMHYSFRSLNALFGGVDDERIEHQMPKGLTAASYWMFGKGEWRPRTRKDLADQRQRILHAQRLIGDPGYRANLMSKFFSNFSAGYVEGLQDRQISPRRLVGGADFDTLRGEMRDAVFEARGNWSAGAIAERLPDPELRRSLGYAEDRGTGFGFLSGLFRGRRARDGGELVEDTREPAQLEPPTRRADVRPIRADITETDSRIAV